MKPRHASWLVLLAMMGVGQFAAAQVDLLAAQADGLPAQQVPATELPDLTAPAQLVSPDATAQLAEPTAAQQLDIVTTAAEQLLDPAADPQSLFPFQEVDTGASTFCGERTPKGACGNVTSATLFAAADPGRSRIRGGGKPDMPGVGDPGPPTTGALPLVCDVGGQKPSTLMKYIPNDNRFVPADFGKECLGNAAVGCDDGFNTVKPNPPSTTNSCCSCYLYAAFCFPAGQKKLTYAQDKTLLTGVDHVLVMPTASCTGVENWNKAVAGSSGKMCPGENIWTEAQRVIDAAGLTDGHAWGAAINPVSRRGQHQMHIHVARVSNSMHSIIAYAYWVLGQKQSFNLDCGILSSSTRLDQCKFTVGQPTTNTLLVEFHSAPNGKAEEVKPFELAYTPTQLNRGNNDVLWTSTLVLRVPSTTLDTVHFAVIKNKHGPAECFFQPGKDGALARGCQ